MKPDGFGAGFQGLPVHFREAESSIDGHVNRMGKPFGTFQVQRMVSRMDRAALASK